LARTVAKVVRKQPTINVVEEVISKLGEMSTRFAKSERDSAESAKWEKLVESKLREILYEETPSVQHISTFISDVLEHMGPVANKAVTLILAIPIHFLWSTIADVRKRQFGNAKLTPRESLWVLGTALVEIGKVCRTGDTTPITKGRGNPDLIDTIKAIRRHQRGKLSYRELKDAIDYTGLHCPQIDQLRLFEFRARKGNRL